MESRGRVKGLVCAVAIATACGTIQSIVFATQDGDGSPSTVIDTLNARLAAAGKNVRVDQAELFVLAARWDGSATTILANDRELRTSAQFVENDPRRGGFAEISYLVDQSDGTALGIENGALVTVTNAQTEAAVDRSMLRWQNQAGCPGPVVTKVGDSGADPDLVDGIVFANPALIGTPFADITHAGWLPRQFFDALAPNGSASILGITFSLVFVDANGSPTDIDRNGAADVAFREIYYNRRFPWTPNAANPSSIHLDTVITHESGHAFGLGHFGKLFVTVTGELRFAPRVVMNAGYVSAFSELTATDIAAICSIWANGQ